MKKTYIIPESLTVVFSAIHMMAQTTLPINNDDETDDPDEWLTKENKSIWDENW